MLALAQRVLITCDARNDQTFPSLERVNATYQHIPTYDLEKGDLRTYQQQYGDIYFLRLAKLKPVVEAVAAEAWEGYQVWKARALAVRGKATET